jgi:2-dehydro-3-deoxygluconokinase
MVTGALWPAGHGLGGAHGPGTPGPGGHVVACIGETMAALVPAELESLATASTLRVDVAGAESNVAMYLADHGVRARWISRLGDDALGRRVARTVGAAGVDVSGVTFDPARSTGLLFKDPGPSAAPGARATRVTYYRRDSAASAMGPHLLADQALRTASLWHLSGITPALSPSCRALTRAALDVTHSADRPRPVVSFDVNYRAALWVADETAGDLLRELADAADIVFVGLDEAAILWGAAAREPAGVRALLPSPRIVVVKDAARGATAFHGDTLTLVPALRVDVVEPVGAGDAFAAGFLAELLNSGDVVRCLRSGHLTAASALTVAGDHGPLPEAAIREHLLTTDDATWARAQFSRAGPRPPGRAARRRPAARRR